MDNQGEQLAVREVAVEHHHVQAKRFVEWYEDMAKSRFANAFAYGRHKVDVLLDETLKELPARAQILDVGCEPENTSVAPLNLGLLPVGWSRRTPCVQPQ